MSILRSSGLLRGTVVLQLVPVALSVLRCNEFKHHSLLQKCHTLAFPWKKESQMYLIFPLLLCHCWQPLLASHFSCKCQCFSLVAVCAWKPLLLLFLAPPALPQPSPEHQLLLPVVSRKLPIVPGK